MEQETVEVVAVRTCSCMGDNKEHVIREGRLVKHGDGTYSRE